MEAQGKWCAEVLNKNLEVSKSVKEESTSLTPSHH